jgi:hypothetical protein
LRKLIRSLAATGVVAGWESKGQERFPPNSPQTWRPGQGYWDRLLIGPDLEASRLGVTRQSIIKVWLAERLERRRDPAESAVAEPTSF